MVPLFSFPLLPQLCRMGKPWLSSEVLQRLGGEVTMRLYPRMGHTINRDEIRFVRSMIAALIASEP